MTSLLLEGSANLSIAQKIAMLPRDARDEVLAGVDPESLLFDWHFWARPSQRCPEGDWGTWVIMAGRGFGKTRSAAEWIHERVRSGFAKRILLLGRTTADVRDVMIFGPSGLMNTGRPSERPEYFPSKRLLVFPGGAEALIFSADEPDQLRGPAGDTAWADEFASYPQTVGVDGLSAFDNLRLTLREQVPGDMPRMVLTTTPRRVPAMFKILKDAAEKPELKIVVTGGSTYDNLANLADTYRDTILGLHEGTRLGEQELMGRMLEDAEGALFTPKDFDDNRVDRLPVARMFTVVGVDPSVAERPRDECGIVVMKATMERDYYRRHLYVVEDASVLGSPSVWSKRVAEMARKWNAPIVAEGNQGGELVRMAIAQSDSNLPVHIVHARVGKAIRAEPIAAIAQQGRLHMVGWFPDLEGQSSQWVPAESKNSPDRMDAMVHAALSLSTRQKGVTFTLGRHLRARSTRQRLPAMSGATFSKRSQPGRAGVRT